MLLLPTSVDDESLEKIYNKKAPTTEVIDAFNVVKSQIWMELAP